MENKDRCLTLPLKPCRTQAMNVKQPQLVTFGCRLNTYESEVMRAHAFEAGLEDAIIFNTCAVTKEAERSARQAIRKARRENPDAKIIVTGCSAQIDPDTYAAMEEVDQIIGNDLKLKADSWGGQNEARVLVNDIMSVTETASHMLEGFQERSRAFIQVQNGCDHRCTFCIIPYGRGNSRSVPIGVIVDQVRALVAGGYNEIVMTGVDVTSYGSDLPGKPTFGQMIRRVLNNVSELPRLRLSSLDPVEIDDDMWDLIQSEPRLMPHLHLSLQAGDDMILKRMKRRHLRQDVIDVCSKARKLRPGMSFGADIIAGFPTETDEMFQNTMEIVRECELTFLHVFPYSEREGTPAAKMPQVEPKLRKSRAALLRKLGEQQLLKFMNCQVNKNAQVIVEKGNIGRTEEFAEVQLDKEKEVGSLVNVYIEKLQGGTLHAKVID